ncbi:VOC family protein [Yoonia sp. 208BN28-4]|uniref:VOC family protein n=1 Tax=Yoonia sp. 208BN28-4 TaxID=3126505 RepID=UPI0030A21DAE
MANLEHINITVADPHQTAALFDTLFGWHIRWEGPTAAGDGYMIHVGSTDSYVSLYKPDGGVSGDASDGRWSVKGGMNHIGVVVDDFAKTRKAVEAAGYTVHGEPVYEPGRRFYFFEDNGIEIEVVSYA